ncbi:DUF4031 domain-containing protein [Cupriavidus sp. CV2]|uniref:DUF4031 domain-containing protein n=1 Tax=Cupriavidus ulmosensis TaxID=3065913 RepID=UPI00296B40E1|nr:DUF4031 domain-containing protein [Cupriavidus sp. CV2]MDW3682984.1 DUF4031 domain-containing protein [Cupriavidus sp. CV2]
MAVYVDDMEASYRRMVMCHMVADTTAELLDMADKIGVARRWLQKPGHYQEHFDICKAMRVHAVKLGAIEIDRAKLGELLRSKKAASRLLDGVRHDGFPEAQ